ncbi:MAG: carboxypeptidase-like regulatory domain-containing protein [Planctomycetaceae bacterium]|jgi:hypothetical protein|nr:carboxypeptidase-like regulatory domain-containing protein [Planctomycetaceae bacterium]
MNNYKKFSLSFKISLITIFISLLLGCSGSNISGLVPCEGTVQINGQPVENANVIFSPKTSGRSAGGMTDNKGFYKLHTNVEVGVLPGEYHVTIVKSVPATEKDAQLIREMQTAAEQNDGVVPSAFDNAVVNFKSLTGKYDNQKTSDLTVVIPDKGNKQQNFNLVVEQK